MKKTFSLLLTVAFGLSVIVSSAVAVEVPVYFGDNFYPVPNNTLILDSNDTGGDVTLRYGTTNAESLYWDDSDSEFVLTDAIGIGGSARVTGSATSVLTGSIDPIASTTVTGVGTAFQSELNVGDRITVTGETRTVTAIASDTSLTVDTAFTDNANDTSPDKLAAALLIKDAAGNLDFVVSDQGYVGIGTRSPSAALHVVPAGAVGASFQNDGTTADDTTLIDIANAAAEKWRIAVGGTGNGASITDGSFYIEDEGGAGVALMIQDATGRVGIGTTSPAGPLHVTGDTSSTGQIDAFYLTGGSNSNGTSTGPRINFGTAQTIIGALGAEQVSTTAGDLVLSAYSSGYIEGLRIDDSGYVGVNNASPSAPFDLDVADGTNDTGYIAEIVNQDVTAGQSNGLLIQAGVNTNDEVLTVLNEAGTKTILDVEGGGMIGIMTDSPAASLDIRPVGSSTSTLELTSPSAQNVFTIWNNAKDTIYLNVNEVGDVSFQSTNKVIFTDGVDVGIGDSSPNSRLDVHSASSAADIAITSLGTNTDVSLKFELSDGSPSFTVGVDDSDSDKFKISTTALGTNDRLVIDASGSVGIGTATPMGSSFTLNNHYIDTDSTYAIRAWGTDHTDTTNYERIEMFHDTTNHAKISVAAGGTGVYRDLRFVTSGNNRMTIQADGDVGIGTTGPTYDLELAANSAGKPGGGSWTDTSDERLKTNITYMDSKQALDLVMRLKGVNFEWIHPEEHGNEDGVTGGFIAQDVERVLPQFVGVNDQIGGHDASLVAGEAKTLQLNFEFDALIVEAIKELKSENDMLKAALCKQDVSYDFCE